MNLKRRTVCELALSLAALPFLGLTGCTDRANVTATAGSHGGSSESSSLSVDGVLRAGVRADVVGFGYLNEGTGNYYGLEIDLVNDLAQRLGYDEVSFVTVTPDDRKEMLLDGRIDLIAACYSIADSRLQNFDFSPAYYDDAVIAVVQNSSMLSSIDDLRGHTFGTMSGSNAAPLLSQKLYDIGFTSGVVETANEDNSDVSFDTWHLLQFPSYEELSHALETGMVDAMVLDGAIAHTYMDDKRAVLEGFRVADQSYGIATQKGSSLSDAVYQTVQEMFDDGTVAQLIDKWD